MPAILAKLRCYDWISGDVSRVPHRHRNSRQASGGDHLQAHLENYAPISLMHLRFPCNVNVRTLWPKPPKPIRLLVRLYLLLRLHHPLYRDTCADVWWCAACGIAIRYAYRRPKYRDASVYHYDPSCHLVSCHIDHLSPGLAILALVCFDSSFRLLPFVIIAFVVYYLSHLRPCPNHLNLFFVRDFAIVYVRLFVNLA